MASQWINTATRGKGRVYVMGGRGGVYIVRDRWELGSFDAPSWLSGRAGDTARLSCLCLGKTSKQRRAKKR